jgi:hypothetical protein
VSPRPLPFEVQLLALLVLGAFTGWVLSLIRRQRLHLREALIWLLSTLSAVVITAWPELLVTASKWVGIQVPANALFGAALLYLALNVLAVTIGVSQNTTNVRRLTQECALLRAELEKLRGSDSSGPGGQDPERADR